MKAKLRVAMLSLVLAWVPAIAAGQEPGYVGLEQRLTPAQLREVGLTAAQIELLDRYLRESEFAPAPPVETARDENGDGRRRERSHFIGLDEGSIRSRLVGSVTGWEPGTVFKLENGQQWKVLKGQMKLRKPYEATEILVVPGIAGRWFLQVDEDLPKARVYRID